MSEWTWWQDPDVVDLVHHLACCVLLALGLWFHYRAWTKLLEVTRIDAKSKGGQG